MKYAKKPEILNCVKQVIGPNLAIWNQSFFAKPGINGKATPWHQDGEYWPIKPLESVTVWLSIDEVTEENVMPSADPQAEVLKEEAKTEAPKEEPKAEAPKDEQKSESSSEKK